MSKRDFRELQDTQFDVAVIGGGIIGTGIARDAAMRGLRVALVEKEDFCYGTSSGSTRLIHGGLRYLEMYDFALVHEDLREREVLLRIAPHLVFPMPFVLPIYDRSLFYRLKLRAGMLLYDVLSYGKSLPHHRFLTASETLNRVPGLRKSGLQGAALYYDATTPRTERLCMENVISARRHGATVLNHACAVGLHRDGARACCVRVSDTLTGTDFQVRSRMVVNSTGPWLNETTQAFGIKDGDLIRKTKGVHLVTPKVSDHAVVLFAERDRRLFFVVPWLGFSYVGTTDTDYGEELDTVSATAEDVEYLLREVQRAFPREAWDPVYYTTAAVRSLVRIEGVPESSVSRKHVIFDHKQRDGIDGLLSVVGGKLTAYRAIAEDAVRHVCRKLGVRRRSRTATVPLPGGGTGDLNEYIARKVEANAGRYPLDTEQLEHLIRLYGARYTEVADLTVRDPDLARRFHADRPDSPAQVLHAVEHESALTLTDYMLRRSDVGLQADQGATVVALIAGKMAGYLGWDDARLAHEIEDYEEHVERSRAYRRETELKF